ncbi:MAG: hypothetical protein AAFP22_06510, partial [Planctomycetota bacterium]
MAVAVAADEPELSWPRLIAWTALTALFLSLGPLAPKLSIRWSLLRTGFVGWICTAMTAAQWPRIDPLSRITYGPALAIVIGVSWIACVTLIRRSAKRRVWSARFLVAWSAIHGLFTFHAIAALTREVWLLNFLLLPLIPTWPVLLLLAIFAARSRDSGGDWRTRGAVVTLAAVTVATAGPLIVAAQPHAWAWRLGPLAQIERGRPAVSVYEEERFNLWFDDDGYVLAGSPHAEDPSCVELNLEGIGWSDNAVHVVRKGRPNRL